MDSKGQPKPPPSPTQDSVHSESIADESSTHGGNDDAVINIDVTAVGNGRKGTLNVHPPRYGNSKVKWRYSPRIKFRDRRRPKCKLMICITAYNEGRGELEKTLIGVVANLQQMWAEFAGQEGAFNPNEVVIVIVCDGKEKMDATFAKYLKENGMFDPEKMAANPSKEIELHMFLSQVALAPAAGMDKELTALRKLGQNKFDPVRVMLCIKDKNSGKLESHRVCIDAVAHNMRPEFVFMIDCGTRPLRDSLFRMTRYMVRNPKVGGCCGEITVEGIWNNLLNIVVAAQAFEYKVSHCISKAMQHVTGFISVLPGAFSLYRYSALVGGEEVAVDPRHYTDIKKDSQGKPIDCPLTHYFKTVLQGRPEGPMEANKYLAEDRILCLQLSMCWVLAYVAGAVAETDVPDTLGKLITQRRRWQNGAQFCDLHAVCMAKDILWHSKHTKLRKLKLMFGFAMILWDLLMTWFLMGSIYVALQMGMMQTLDSPVGRAVFQRSFSIILMWIYFQSLDGRKPTEQWRTYWLIAILLMLFTYGGLSAAILYGNIHPLALVMMAAGLAGIVIAALLHRQVMICACTFVQYFLLLPTFGNVFVVYAITQLYDITWGDDHNKKASTERTAEDIAARCAAVVAPNTVPGSAPVPMPVVAAAEQLQAAQAASSVLGAAQATAARPPLGPGQEETKQSPSPQPEEGPEAYTNGADFVTHPSDIINPPVVFGDAFRKQNPKDWENRMKGFRLKVMLAHAASNVAFVTFLQLMQVQPNQFSNVVLYIGMGTAAPKILGSIYWKLEQNWQDLRLRCERKSRKKE